MKKKRPLFKMLTDLIHEDKKNTTKKEPSLELFKEVASFVEESCPEKVTEDVAKLKINFDAIPGENNSTLALGDEQFFYNRNSMFCGKIRSIDKNDGENELNCFSVAACDLVTGNMFLATYTEHAGKDPVHNMSFLNLTGDALAITNARVRWHFRQK